MVGKEQFTSLYRPPARGKALTERKHLGRMGCMRGCIRAIQTGYSEKYRDAAEPKSPKIDEVNVATSSQLGSAANASDAKDNSSVYLAI